MTNIEYAIDRFGESDREYRVTFGASGMIVSVYDRDTGKLIAEIWGSVERYVKISGVTVKAV